MIPVLLADTQAIFRAGMARVLDAEADLRLLGQCDGTDTIGPLLKENRNSILLASVPAIADFDSVTTHVRASGSRLVLILDVDETLPNAWTRRIDCQLSRQASTDDLLRCVRRVAAGERCASNAGIAPEDATGRRIRDSLTARELQIVGYIVQGWKNRQIADEIGTKEQVVKNYLRSIYDKTGASDRLELALFTLHHRVLADAAAKTTGLASAARQP